MSINAKSAGTTRATQASRLVPLAAINEPEKVVQILWGGKGTQALTPKKTEGAQSIILGN